MATQTTAREIGARVGRAIARDVLADADLSREWTGLDPQDGDQFQAAGLTPGSPEWTAAECAAETAYREALDEVVGPDATPREGQEGWAMSAQLIRDNVDEDALIDYLTADSGDWLGVYSDGTVYTGESVGSEIDPDEQPVCRVRCPGLGNVDMTWWRKGWDCDGLDDEDVIRQCCRDGDVSDELAELQRRLIEAAAEVEA